MHTSTTADPTMPTDRQGRAALPARTPRLTRAGLAALAAPAALVALAALWPLRLVAADLEALRPCRLITDPAQRLACYDAATEPATPPAPAPEAAPAPPAVVLDSPVADRHQRSLIGDRWGLGAPPEDSRFDVRAHRPSYLLLGRVSDAPNRMPTTPSKPPLAGPLGIQGHEAKYQLSFKIKLADFARELPLPLSIWAAYTQQSHWQVFNSGNSRPFRETNYEPELMVATHPDLTLWGWRWRLAALGINHQSNGRSEPLSRSWNRVIAQVGVERGNLAVVARPWVRIREAAGSDDNPDIVEHLGHGDLTLVWAPGAHQFSLTSRLHLGNGRGAVQAHWTFPMVRRVRGVVQWFSGYGESLVDYNRRQNTLGIGISLADHL